MSKADRFVDRDPASAKNLVSHSSMIDLPVASHHFPPLEVGRAET
jgi:hypothetical protein